MPTTYTLQHLGNFDCDFELEFAVVDRDYGDGYERSELVGHSEGQWYASLVYSALPQSAGQAIVDEQSGLSMSRADYILNFFIKRQQDGAAFWVRNLMTDEDVLMKFAEHRLSLKLVQAQLWSTGLALKQYRAAS